MAPEVETRGMGRVKNEKKFIVFDQESSVRPTTTRWKRRVVERPLIEATALQTRGGRRPWSIPEANVPSPAGNLCLWPRRACACCCRGDGRCLRGLSAAVFSSTNNGDAVVRSLAYRLRRALCPSPRTPRPARSSRFPIPSTRPRRRLPVRPEAVAIPRQSACWANATLRNHTNETQRYNVRPISPFEIVICRFQRDSLETWTYYHISLHACVTDCNSHTHTHTKHRTNGGSFPLCQFISECTEISFVDCFIIL